MLSTFLSSKKKKQEQVFPIVIDYTGEKITINTKEELVKFFEHCNTNKTYENINKITLED